MNRFWSNIIHPIIKSINANYIIEIGSDTGINTQNILEYCLEYDTHMAAIDPFPKFDVDEFKAKYGDKFEIYNELSLSRLPLLKDYDVILLDGDHNWYTVYNELKIIEKSFKNKKFPVVFLHDVGWPYARRDLYYNPENIPEAYRQPYKKLGMYPGQTGLKKQGGLNTHLYNSIYENNPKNGILTAIEDFTFESDLEFSFKVINGFHGLCILFSVDDELENIIDNVIESADLLDNLEEERVKLTIAHLEEEIRSNSLEKELTENKTKLEQFQSLLNQTVNKLGQRENKLESSNKLIQRKERQLGNIKIQLNQIVNKLDLTESKLKSSNEVAKEKEIQLRQVKSGLDQTKDQLDISHQLIEEKESQLRQANGKIKVSNQLVKEKEKQLEEAKIKFNQAEHQLKQSENQLNASNKLIQEKQDFIANAEKREKEVFEALNLQIDNLKASLIEMEHLNNKGRSITQRLISKFPSMYILFNINETGIKNALVNIKGYKSIKKNKLVDTGFYLKNNKSVRLSGMDPILHYMYHGFNESKRPNPTFDGDYYLKRYKDVKESNLNPLVHYSLYGINEKRSTFKNQETSGSRKNSDNLTDYKLKNKFISDLFNSSTDLSNFIDYNADFSVNLRKEDIKLISFYLPQFHPIPENDKFWGKGFTEWTNVTKALPKFIGHYQPHLPIDLGFYDLRLIETQKRQIELAKKYGIFGFCFHYYWFNGKRLLEKPLNMFLDNPDELDLPFCLCWANENWTKRWDGMDNEVIISQKYSAEDDLDIIKDLSRYFKDKRYIKMDNKILIIIYKPQLLPDPKKTFAIWREYCKNKNIGELFILGVKRHDFVDPETYGLDAAVEFPPNTPHPTQRKNVHFLEDGPHPMVFDLEKFVESRHYLVDEDNYKKFKTVIPSWDNTARRGSDGQVYVGNPDVYKKWLKDVITLTKEKMGKNEQFVFINAWNEWAEGAHLEPDRKFGYGYLKATADAVIETRDKLNEEIQPLETKYKVSVIMPTYDRENIISRAIDSVVNQTFSNYQLIICDDGSTDDTESLIKLKYGTYLKNGKIIYIMQENKGVSKARNAALKHADGNLIAYLDSDNCWNSSYLEKMVSVFDKNSCNAAYCAMVVNDTHEDAIYKKHQFIRNEEYDRDKLVNANFIDLNIFMHKKSLYDEMGGFNESLRSMVDWDLILRYTRFNEPYFLNEVLAEYFLDKELNNITYSVNHDDDYCKLLESHSYEKIMKEKLDKINSKRNREKMDEINLKNKKISIKVPAPDMETAHNWGDYHFALALKKEFEKNSYETAIHLSSQWDEDDDAGIVLVLRGLIRYKPKPGQFNIMWNISHPDMISIDEYNEFDHVFVASDIWADHLKTKLNVPVESLIQCTDPELFYPERSCEYKHDLLFVGNSRNVFRKIVKDLLPTDKDFGLYGNYWDQFVDKKYITGRHIPNTELHKAYSSCKVLLNDHWEDMAEKGFISNRLFDGLAAGAFIISDEIQGAREIFGDVLVTYSNADELHDLIDYYLDNDLERVKKVEKGREIVLANHTFSKRAEHILDVIEKRHVLLTSQTSAKSTEQV